MSVSTQTIPLFPLGTTLYPDGLLDLKIFEVRYLDMIKECVRDNTPFGVVTINQGSEVRQPNEQLSLMSFGTLAHIAEFEAVQPSLFFIRCQGGQRFRLNQYSQEKNGLWIGEVELMPDDKSCAIPEHVQDMAQRLGEIIVGLKGRGLSEAQIPFASPYLLDDCAWVANRWCEIMPISAAQKNHLLSIDHALIRLELAKELLEQLEQGDTPLN